MRFLILALMKAGLFLTLFLISLSVSSIFSQYASRTYYLIDSMQLDDLTKRDRDLLDSTLLAYHSEKVDTTKLTIVLNLAYDLDNSYYWPKYLQLVYQVAENRLASKPENKKINRFYQKLRADALGNIGYHYMSNLQDAMRAMEYYEKAMIAYQKTENLLF